MFWLTRLRRALTTTTTGRRVIQTGNAAMFVHPTRRATQERLLPQTRDTAQTPPHLPPCKHLHSSSTAISSEPSATGRFTFPRLPADSQLCFELKRAHTNTRPSAISVAICLLIFPGRADTVQQTDKQHERSGVEQSIPVQNAAACQRTRLKSPQKGNFCSPTQTPCTPPRTHLTCHCQSNRVK